VKREKSLNGFKVGTCIGRFSSDGAASAAVKGLKCCCCSVCFCFRWDGLDTGWKLGVPRQLGDGRRRGKQKRLDKFRPHASLEVQFNSVTP